MWISGRDIRHPQNEQAPKGQYLLVNDQDERNLGLGKLLPKRLRNMLPRGLI
jgi:NOL1/NOP2/fmu family ribosome biogenesis protein